MNIHIRNLLILSGLISTLTFQSSTAFAQGTVFTYQGRFNDGGTPANGTNYSMGFNLYDASTNGSLLGNLVVTNVALSNGMFTVPLDFGSVFNGNPRWLGISVRTNSGGFTNLWPRQQLTPTPYAIMAGSASNLLGVLPVAQLGGIVPLSQLPSVVVTNSQNGFDLAFNGNIGIGIQNPQQRLSVAGIVESTTGGFKFPDGSVQTYAEPWIISGGSIYYNAGGVGIGTATPTAQLDVNGTIRATTFNGNGLIGWLTASNNQMAFVNAGYIATNNLSQVIVTLPVTTNYGNIVEVSGGGAAGWKIAQNSGQTILAGNLVGNVATVWSAQNSTVQSWSAVASSSDGTKLVAGINGGTIYTSSDSGATWVKQTASGAQTWQSVATSSDGTKIVAVVNSGQINTSSDSGLTWATADSTRNWQAVASSGDGSRLVAVVNGGQIYISSNSGATWTPEDISRNWQSVASSADGSKLVAVVKGGQIFTSVNYGTNWTAKFGAANWQSVASSSDGTKLVAAISGGQIYASSDSGATWAPQATSQSWQSVASSADGTRLVAVISSGQIYTSPDSGATWTARASSQVWASVASSSDGTKLVAAVNGGQIYTSHPVIIQGTTVGTAGYLSGGQNTAVQLLFVGNGQWMPISHEGSIAAY